MIKRINTKLKSHQVESEESEIGYARRVVRGQFNLGDNAETIVIPEKFLKTLKGDRFMHLDVLCVLVIK